jgi:hypothetical protein
MGTLRQTSETGEPAAGPTAATGRADTVWAPSAGAYLTDGSVLFRVADTLVDKVGGNLFLELEDCTTLEIVLCPARSVTELALHPITPASTS